MGGIVSSAKYDWSKNVVPKSIDSLKNPLHSPKNIIDMIKSNVHTTFDGPPLGSVAPKKGKTSLMAGGYPTDGAQQRTMYGTESNRSLLGGGR